ncbi:MAG: hypothetical protein LBE09_04715, partial [Christensenellaceae bacterium]|nr:hypothetical protein [Christensenellaceae bacterium]
MESMRIKPQDERTRERANNISKSLRKYVNDNFYNWYDKSDIGNKLKKEKLCSCLQDIESCFAELPSVIDGPLITPDIFEKRCFDQIVTESILKKWDEKINRGKPKNKRIRPKDIRVHILKACCKFFDAKKEDIYQILNDKTYETENQSPLSNLKGDEPHISYSVNLNVPGETTEHEIISENSQDAKTEFYESNSVVSICEQERDDNGVNNDYTQTTINESKAPKSLSLSESRSPNLDPEYNLFDLNHPE